MSFIFETQKKIFLMKSEFSVPPLTGTHLTQAPQKVHKEIVKLIRKN